MKKNTLVKTLIVPIAIITFTSTAHAEEVLVKTILPIKTELHGTVNVDDQRTVPIVTGTVTAINGSTITMTSKVKSSTISTIYTVDASAARIQKNKEAGTISSIAIGDTIAVNGTVVDSKITAKIIIAGTLPASMPNIKGQREKEQNKSDSDKDAPADIKAFMDSMGDGQPIVAGTITAISGSTITITNKSNVTYTINATNAAITRGTTKKAAVGTLAVGDTLVAQGAINGNVVTATMIISKPVPATTATAEVKVGLFGKIGSFFARIFGF